ncbi:imidazole glycerol phosphate synthase subunit HisF [Gammaproteobacteria bacterium]|jgi:cyclase|nr:imidazole glycerol phosphate synthase subunit HisF [Gammaproteobacteria bacterium]MDC0884306.1 imidazole glycerol phosphate synthase subunit HisF [Gammaproteobacteria bacterium]|tara:strand:+ start:431 stop:1198 length:768 start_codon:yes stop_codon:yes gene_type:complete
MITKRIIPCLDVKDGKVVKGIQFKNHQVVGSILDLAEKYSNDGADELVFYDISASTKDSIVEKNWISKIADVVNIPFCVAGGIKSVEDARQILNLGADKISINTPAIDNPDLIYDLSNEFGSQCVVIGMDVKYIGDQAFIFAKTGSEKTSHSTNLNAKDWLIRVQELGAGEVVVNAMGNDGVKSGYSIELLNSLEDICSIPMIASGGAGGPRDFVNVFEKTNVDGALAASIFHRNEYSIKEIKESLKANSINIRI